jgi:hypothetical protein
VAVAGLIARLDAAREDATAELAGLSDVADRRRSSHVGPNASPASGWTTAARCAS